MNSWEAILRGVKPEYLGLNSNIHGLEIYSLGPQVSIITRQKRDARGLEAAAKP